MGARSLGDLYVTLSAKTSGFVEAFQNADWAMRSFQIRAQELYETNMQAFGGQALEAMVRFGAEAVTAFLESEKVAQRLEHAVQRAGVAIPGFTSKLGEAADVMERATGVDGDYIKSLQQLALQFQVAPALIERTTKAALDWSHATGGSAKAAMQMLTSANAENLEQLAKWGVQVDDSDVRTRGMVAVLEQFEKVYGGATDQMHEASKSIALNQAAWGDLKKAIGQTVTEMLHFTGVAKASAGVMDALTELFSSKKAAEVDEYRKRTDALTEATERYVNLQAKIDEDMALLFRLGPSSPLLDQTADSISESRKLLAQFEQDLNRVRGIAEPKINFAIPALNDRGVDAKNAIGIFERGTPLWEAWDKEQKKQAEALKETIKALNDAIDEAYLVDVETTSSAGDLFGLTDRMRDLANGIGDGVTQANEKRVAASTKKAAEAMRDMAEAVAQAAREATAALATRALGSIGELGGIISNAMQAAAAGPWAVVASIAMDLLSKSDTFKAVVDTLNGILQVVADALGALLKPLLPLVGAIGLLVTALLPLLDGVGQLVAAAIEPLVPLLVVLSTVLTGLMPIITILQKAFMMITNPLVMLGGPVLRAVFEVLQFVGIIILTVAKALGDVWNGIISAVQAVFDSLASISVLGVKPLGFLAGWSDSLESAKVDTEAMAKALMELEGLTWDLAKAKAEEAAATYRNYEATKKATEALTNVPAMWKRALRTGQAQDRQAPPSSMPGLPGTGTVGTPPGAPAPVAGVATPEVVEAVGAVGDVGNGLFGRRSAQPAVATMQTFIFNGYDSTQVADELERRRITNASRRDGAPLTALGGLQVAAGVE
jgi:hypothetical protein